MFTTPSRARDARSSAPIAGESRSTRRGSRAGTPVFGGQDPISPPTFLSPSISRRDANIDATDVSSSSSFLTGNVRTRTTRARPRPSSLLAASGPNLSLLSPSNAFDREASVLSDDDARSVADTVHSTGAYGRRPPVLFKDAKAQLEEGTVLLGDQWVQVSAFSKLPTEVLEVLNEADLYIDAFQGHLDVQTGYACMLSRTQCFVWNYSSRGIGTGSPTCFTFPVPQYASSSMSAINDLSHCCFLSRAANREPALLLVAPDGQTCLWEGIASSLTRQDRAQRVNAPLSANETVIQLERVEETTVVLATSQSRLLRVSVGSRAGILQAEIRPFSQPRGLLGRLFGSTSAMGSSNDQIASIAIAPVQAGKQGREVYAIGKKTLQKWQVLDQGGERLVAEQDIQQVVASSVLQLSKERYSAAQSLAFDMLDGAVQSDGRLVLLYSQGKAEHQPLNYGLAVLDAVKDAGSFVVANVLALNYASFADPRPYAQPSLSLPNGGPAAFVSFADTVVAKQLEVGCESFEEVIKLKDDVKNRFIGSGCDTVDVGDNAVAALSLISATSGSLLVETSITEVRKRCTAYTNAADRQRADTERLKWKLEQALYYSESALNPLIFQLPSHLQGTLMTACEDLSRELLTFSNLISKKIPPSVDLKAALKDRQVKLRFLVKFVAQCGHLEKLPQTTKRQLRSAAELAASLTELWVYQNEFYTCAHDSTAQSPLTKAIEMVMVEHGFGIGSDDVVRKFFRNHADLSTKVLDQLLKQSKLASTQPLRSRSIEVLELNRITLSAYRAALRYRKEFGPLYGLTESNASAYEPWTAQPVSTHLLETLFSVTVNLIPDRNRELGSAIDVAATEFSSASEEQKREQKVQSELKAQLCSLAEIALSCYSERLGYLEAVAGSETSFERELAVFSTTYRSARPEFIKPLVGIGRSDKAFTLAEQYRDFRTLVELCNEASLRSEARMDRYLETYRESFAFELYSFYIEQDQPRKVLEQKAEYSSLVLAYLNQPGHYDRDRLGWLHDVALKRFDTTSVKLENLASKESSLPQRKMMLSLSKLAYLSDLAVQDIQTVGVQQSIEEKFDDNLDLIAVQESLVALWENAIGGFPDSLPSAFTPEAQELANQIVDTIATRLQEYPAYRSHYVDLVQRLLFSSQYLSSEDLIDLLTLKDAPENQLEDFATAIKVVVRAFGKDVPKQRLDASLGSIWRRAVIRDDWIALGDTQGISDEVILADLKATAFYAVLNEVLGDETNRSAYVHVTELIKEPVHDNDESMHAQGEQNDLENEARKLLEARFLKAPDHYISLLLHDHLKEVATVASFLEDSDLPRLATELAAQAAAETGSRDQRRMVIQDGDDESVVGQDSMLIE
ncbi:uncharacterized protein MEPE_02559 [Melanopsichium pennsylvanicum]|uniref:Uncharacterized protein n=2 Tax=Melanopsichium pennsylvanicum TaxID=63383 RepID=A0AAJ5C4M8_9BASI|nr:subunit of the nup84p subcomplex of the nuclear pore complex [Melanopsichium pennsylvanicum 4]SNX83851.1 uncharacterized protein MEPE_02559 [Melanopsichium pennsylvanicum]